MSFYIVIYSSLGMSAFWEIHEKVQNHGNLWGFSREGAGSRLGPISGGFWDHFGSSWYPKSENGGPGNLNEKRWKKSDARLADYFRLRGGAAL